MSILIWTSKTLAAFVSFLFSPGWPIILSNDIFRRLVSWKVLTSLLFCHFPEDCPAYQVYERIDCFLVRWVFHFQKSNWVFFSDFSVNKTFNVEEFNRKYVYRIESRASLDSVNFIRRLKRFSVTLVRFSEFISTKEKFYDSSLLFKNNNNTSYDHFGYKRFIDELNIAYSYASRMA